MKIAKIKQIISASGSMTRLGNFWMFLLSNFLQKWSTHVVTKWAILKNVPFLVNRFGFFTKFWPTLNSNFGSHWSQDLCFRRSRVERNSEGIRSPTQPCLGQQDWVPVRPGRCLQVDQEYPKAWTGGLLRSCRCCHQPPRWHWGHRQPVHPARRKMLA